MEIASIISFALKMSAITMVVWLFWYVFLRKITNFSLLRVFLIGGLTLSMFMPLVVPFLQSKLVLYSVNFGLTASYTLSEVVILYGKNSFDWWRLFSIIYILISIFFIIRFVIQLVRIAILISNNKIKRLEGLSIVEHQENISPFSFMNYCFLNPSLVPNDKVDGVIVHERAHSRELHSIDILLFEISGFFQWFNPFYWLLRKALVEVHEYQADSTAIRSKIDPHAYLDAIVSIAFHGIALPVGNNFNKSLTLKRLAMISITKQSKGAIVKLAIALIVSLPIIIALSCDKTAEPATASQEVEALQSPPPPPPKSGDYEGEVFVRVEEMPGFDGGTSEKFREYIAQNLKYPEEAASKKIEGRVFVSFIVEKDGTVTNVRIVRGVDPILDNEAIRVVESSPKWTPGKQRGELVRTTFTFPITFVLQ